MQLQLLAKVEVNRVIVYISIKSCFHYVTLNPLDERNQICHQPLLINFEWSVIIIFPISIILISIIRPFVQ